MKSIKRLLHIIEPVELYVMGEGRLMRIGLETHETTFVVQSLQLLVIVQLGRENYLAIPVQNFDNEREQFYILPQDLDEDTAFLVDCWKRLDSLRRTTRNPGEVAHYLRQTHDKIEKKVRERTTTYLRIVASTDRLVA